MPIKEKQKYKVYSANSFETLFWAKNVSDYQIQPNQHQVAELVNTCQLVSLKPIWLRVLVVQKAEQLTIELLYLDLNLRVQKLSQ